MVKDGTISLNISLLQPRMFCRSKTTLTLEGIGGQIRDSAEEGTTSVVTTRIADFINNIVAARSRGGRLTSLDAS